MEVLRLLKMNPPLTHPPQEVPVDLTTGAKICHNNLFQQTSYPHLRFHTKRYTDLTDKCFTSVKREKAIPVTVKECKDNDYLRQIKEESHSLGEEKKRRRIEDLSKCEFELSKKRKVETENQKEDIKKGIKDNVKNENDLKYFSLKTLSHQPLPFNVFKHNFLMDRLKNSKSNGTSESMKEIESLLAAVQQSQMLYYSYCAKLLQNLQSQKIIGENEFLSRSLSCYVPSKESTEKEYKESEGEKSKQMKESDVAQSCPKQIFRPPCQKNKSDYNVSSCSSAQVPRLSLSPSISPTLSQRPSSAEDEQSANPFTPKDVSKGSPNRRRAPRALTGKHVRPGTGASPSTLRTLRQKLEERRRLRLAAEQSGVIAGDVSRGERCLNQSLCRKE